ncbi:hypothetical protein AB9F39_37475, partial [Rhizobium leguminosarum]
ALVVTGGGGLCLLAGLLLLWNISGVTEMSRLIGAGYIVRESPLYLAALILVLGGSRPANRQSPPPPVTTSACREARRAASRS